MLLFPVSDAVDATAFDEVVCFCLCPFGPCATGFAVGGGGLIFRLCLSCVYLLLQGGWDGGLEMVQGQMG